MNSTAAGFLIAFVFLVGNAIVMLAWIRFSARRRARQAQDHIEESKGSKGHVVMHSSHGRERVHAKLTESREKNTVSGSVKNVTPPRARTASTRSSSGDDGDFAVSAVVAASTDSTALGYMVGGSLTGALVGEALASAAQPSDSSPSYSSSSDDSTSCSSSSSSSSYDSGSSSSSFCDSSPSYDSGSSSFDSSSSSFDSSSF